MFKIFLTLLVFISTSYSSSLLKTGQTVSYEANGTVSNDGSIKDDGFYQKGVERSYSRSIIGVVTDHVTGLQWQDDEIDNSEWATAITYCTNLPLDGGGWRLPTIEELETLVDRGTSYPALTEGVFVNGWLHGSLWSSTNLVADETYAYTVVFSTGLTSSSQKTSYQDVKCVRGDQLITSSLTRSDNIVSDSVTNLQWQDDEKVITPERTWLQAIDYCEGISLGGHDDWRLPNINELLSIADSTTYNPAIDTSVFVNYVSDYYWSSSTNVAYTAGGWSVHFYSSISSGNPNKESATSNVRCVRDDAQNIPNTHSNPAVIMYLLD